MIDRPRMRSTGILTEQVGDELVLYDSVSRSAHCLSADAAAVWGLCDGRRSPADMAVELGTAAAKVDAVLQELGDAGLLESIPGAERGMSRRAAAKRFAAVGVGALAAPLIYSVAIPRAAAAMSGTNPPPDLCDGKDCDDNNACTIDECNPINGECIHTQVVCNDDDPCTIGRCDPVKGCVFTPYACPPSTNPCMVNACSPVNGKAVCVETPVADGTPCGGDGACYQGTCGD
ncbi:MAG: hypothetical protein ABSF58_00595 [Solirubrobacteraceae bacterium]|jgi:hypothetical protein